MNNILISKLEKNSYKIKILNSLNVYNKETLQKTIKYIISKIKKKNKLKKQIFIDIYFNNYTTIIILKDYNKLIDLTGLTDIKINIHTDTIFLYEVDYFKIKEENIDGKIYYFNNKFYLNPKNINKKEHLSLLEEATIIYENTQIILDKGIKL